LGNLAAIGAAVGLGAAGLLQAEAGSIFVLTQFLFVIGNLVPRKHTLFGVPRDSDGRMLINLLRLPRRGITPVGRAYLESLRGYSPLTDEAELRSNAAPVIVYWTLDAARLAEDDTWTKKRSGLERLLKREVLSSVQEMYVLDALITDGLICNDLCPVADLDRWSQRAIRLGPTCEALTESRAAVLIELGHFAEGRAMIERLGTVGDDFGGMLRRLFLAQAEHGLRNDIEAERLISEAQRIAEAVAAKPPVLARIARLTSAIAPGAGVHHPA
jgi:hypothetical protein